MAAEDTLWGGNGADQFIFEEGPAPAKVDGDVIKDWNGQQGDISTCRGPAANPSTRRTGA